MALEKELETYKAQLPVMSANHGKYVVIHGDQVVGIFEAYGDAIKKGPDDFGLKPFLVKQIQVMEQVQFISRLVAPCRSSLSQ